MKDVELKTSVTNIFDIIIPSINYLVPNKAQLKGYHTGTPYEKLFGNSINRDLIKFYQRL